MARIKGWVKVKENIWRSTEPFFPKGNTYTFVWIGSNNIIRITENLPKRTPDYKIFKHSYIIYKGKTVKQTKDWVINWMKKHP